MKFTMMVVDVFVRFRLSAIERTPQRPQTWVLELLTIEQVAEVLVSLGFLKPEVALRLTNASITITPQEGLVTIPFADIVAVTQFVHPEDAPPSPEAQQGHVLIVQGETTEEALASVGFIMKVDGPLQ